MKEITAENWDYKPRDMYVWDDSSETKKIMYVLSILQSDEKHPVNAPVVVAGKHGWPAFFRHCAELEQAELPAKNCCKHLQVEIFDIVEEVSYFVEKHQVQICQIAMANHKIYLYYWEGEK